MSDISMTATTMRDPIARPSAEFGSTILSVRPALKRFALRLTKDHAAAEDLVQDTLTRAWAARARFAPGSNAKAWLFRIAHNSFVSATRRTRRHVAWDPDRHQMMLVQVATQDDALYARDLARAMSRLPSPQRHALLLVTRDGMSVADAAEKLGIPPGTLKSRVCRARASVLAYVVGDGPSDGDAPATALPTAAPTRPATIHTDEIRSTDRSVQDRYQQWKASGATTIG